MARVFNKNLIRASYRYELVTVLLCATVLFIGASLLSYNPHDRSWWYYSSVKVPITNWCGAAGAQLAAFLFSFFGSAAFGLVFLLSYIMVLHVRRRSVQQEWDRIAASILLILCIATLFAAHQIDFWDSPFPGGSIGSASYKLLVRWFDVFGTAIFLSALLTISFIVATRFSFVGGIQRIITFVRTLFSHPALLALCAAIGKIADLFGRLCKRLWVLVCSYVPKNGSAAQESNAATYALDNEEQFDVAMDAFWQGLQQQEKHAGSSEIAQTAQAPIITPAPIQTDTHAADTGYKLPDASSLLAPVQEHAQFDARVQQELDEGAATLEEKLERFGMSGRVISITRGPVVTLYEYQPEIDTKISKIIALEDDLALALRALSIRIIAPIPGRSVVGFEVANKNRATVYLSRILQSKEYAQSHDELPLVLGADTRGASCIVDLAKMPHLLVAGSTGSGKSVALNTMLISLLCKKTPDELQLILVDPKRLEFSTYADIPHLLFPIVTEAKKAVPVLRWVVQEMELRYAQMQEKSSRNITDFNERNPAERMPHIVVMIDELADLMMTAGRDIEDMLTRISQMARAAGIHLIIATQRPSVDVITGVVKVNFPSRISFRVTSKIDSRTILDAAGAEKLLGRGDMLFMDSQDPFIKRIHGAFVTDQDIAAVVTHVRCQRAVAYRDLAAELPLERADLDIEDDLYNEVVQFLREIEEVSISLLQRKFRIGYNRSARIIDVLESRGLIMPSESGKTRKVIK